MKKKKMLLVAILCTIGICVAIYSWVFRPKPMIETGTEILSMRIEYGQEDEDVTGYFDADWLVEQLSTADVVPVWTRGISRPHTPDILVMFIETPTQILEVMLGGTGWDYVEYMAGDSTPCSHYHIKNPEALYETLIEQLHLPS